MISSDHLQRVSPPRPNKRGLHRLLKRLFSVRRDNEPHARPRVTSIMNETANSSQAWPSGADYRYLRGRWSVRPRGGTLHFRNIISPSSTCRVMEHSAWIPFKYWLFVTVEAPAADARRHVRASSRCSHLRYFNRLCVKISYRRGWLSRGTDETPVKQFFIDVLHSRARLVLRRRDLSILREIIPLCGAHCWLLFDVYSV